ncbi:MAG: hypothetical protein LPK58_06395 [Gammaproteobacteria bacterium]|nr:hypothetical protein [Gammaproteobacteria bacterium]MDX5375203.1 hypothetical protein [Gammaproteobacteria bacterium]
MSKPTDDELKQALAEAARMREQGQDPQHIAKALLNLHYRQRYLEDVLVAAEHYLRGQGEQDHARLMRAIEHYHEADTRTTGRDEESGWLA